MSVIRGIVKFVHRYMKMHLVALLFCVGNCGANAEQIIGKVIGVSDGDTITVLDDSNTQFKIRLSGIDAPEKSQPFGNVSKRHLSDLCYAKKAIVDWRKLDKYKRVIGKVYCDGKDSGLEQVRGGLAWWYQKYAKDQLPEDRILYRDAELMASGNQIGLWRSPDRVAPWDWRHGQR